MNTHHVFESGNIIKIRDGVWAGEMKDKSENVFFVLLIPEVKNKTEARLYAEAFGEGWNGALRGQHKGPEHCVRVWTAPEIDAGYAFCFDTGNGKPDIIHYIKGEIVVRDDIVEFCINRTLLRWAEKNFEDPYPALNAAVVHGFCAASGAKVSMQ